MFQQTNSKYKIIYSLDGYDEISLTSQVKIISNKGEELLSPANLGYSQLKNEDLFGGNSVEEAAIIFLNILEGKGTQEQENVVNVNAAMALQCLNPHLSNINAIAGAEESLKSGKALNVFRKLMELNR